MKHASLLPLAILPFLTSCWMDDPATGTNDEVTTSLQILADNVRGLPAMTSPQGTTAARIATRSVDSASDTLWSFLWMEDHRTWSSWRMYSKKKCTSDREDSTLRQCIERFDANDSDGFSQGVEIYQKDQQGTRSLNFRCDIVTRSGFVWNTTQTLTLNRSGDWSQGLRRVGRFDFPDLGWHCPFDLEDSEDSKEFTRSLASGLPLYAGNRQIGRMVIDSPLGGSQSPRIRWFDMAGHEYIARPLGFRNNAGDSVGLRIIRTRRDTIGGHPGIAIDGRFFIPEHYGLFSDSVTIFASQDSSGSGIPYGNTPSPVGEFTLFLPHAAFCLPDSGWFHLSFHMHSRDPSIVAPAIPTGVFRIP